MHSAVYNTVEKGEMAKYLGEAGPGGAKPQESVAGECHGAIAHAKQTIRAAELSDSLGIDLREALVHSLKKGLAELEQLDPDAPIDPGALSALAQHMLSMSKGSLK